MNKHEVNESVNSIEKKGYSKPEILVTSVAHVIKGSSGGTFDTFGTKKS